MQIKHKIKLGWERTVSFEELVKLMVEADLQANGLVSPNGSDKSVVKDNATIRHRLNLIA